MISSQKHFSYTSYVYLFYPFLLLSFLATPCFSAADDSPFFQDQKDPSKNQTGGFGSPIVSDYRTAAKWLFQRLSGADDCGTPQVRSFVESKLKAAFELLDLKSSSSPQQWEGKKQEIRTLLMNAAHEITTRCPEFLNTRVRQWAVPLSNIAHLDQYRNDMNDFVAFILGNTRDEKNFKELFTGDYSYYVNTSGTSIQGIPSYVDPTPNNTKEKIPPYSYQKSDAHFDAVGLKFSQGKIDIAKYLVSINQKQIPDSPYKNASPGYEGGAYTLYTAMKNWITQGTNRRLIAEQILIGWCLDVGSLRSGFYTDRVVKNLQTNIETTSYIWRNISRTPGGIASNFTNHCQKCHGALDPIVPVVGDYDALPADPQNREKGVTIFAGLTARPAGLLPPFQKIDDADNNPSLPNLVPRVHLRPNPKLAINPWVAPYHPRPEQFAGLGISPDSPKEFTTLKQWGSILTEATRFPICMAMRVVGEMCMTSIQNVPEEIAQEEGAEFAASGFKLQTLFERAATLPQCIGISL